MWVVRLDGEADGTRTRDPKLEGTCSNRGLEEYRAGCGIRALGLLGAAYNLVMAATSYLDRLLDPLTEVFTPEVASALVNLRADAELEAHISELRRKANEGTLTPAEEAEYKDFVEAVDLLAIIQAKARRFLVKHSA